MDNVRFIISRRPWLFSGLLALLLGLMSLLLLPTFLAHAASAQQCTQITASTGGAHGQNSTSPIKLSSAATGGAQRQSTASQGCSIVVEGQTTAKGGAHGPITTCTVKDAKGKKTTVTCTGSQAGTCTVKEVKGQTTVTCTESRKHP